MKLLTKTYSNDPAINLAIEEVLLSSNPTELICFFYKNAESVIVGKNQCVYKEVDIAYCHKENIAIYRRLSGGGTVYHDLGNLNYSLIGPQLRRNSLDYDHYLEQITGALFKMGFDVTINERKGLNLGEKKISGSAMTRSRGSVLCHGTLLYETDLTKLERSVHVSHPNIQSKAINSVQAEVLNLKEQSSFQSMSDFESALASRIDAESEPYSLDDEQMRQVNLLAEAKYRTWSWNICRSSDLTLRTVIRLLGKEHKVELAVSKGVIIKLKNINNDAPNFKPLIGCPYWPDALAQRFMKNYDLPLNEAILSAIMMFGY